MRSSDPLTRVFSELNLGEPEAGALRECASLPRTLRPGEGLAHEGEEPYGLTILVGGVVKAYRELRTGGVQTVALYIAGDLVDAHALALVRSTATVVAVIPSQVIRISRARLEPLMTTYPSLVRVLWRTSSREHSMLREWMVGMGRRTAYGHMAHLMCEMAVRMRRADASGGDSYAFPLTQTELADAVGLSPVHVNRTLQSLRTDGLVELKRGTLRIRDWRRLVEAAEFDPAYLELADAGTGDRDEALLFSLGHPVGL